MKEKIKCIIEGCKRTDVVKKHKICNLHVQRFYKHGYVSKAPAKKIKTHAPFDPKNIR